MSMPTPPGEVGTHLVRLPPKRALSSPSPEPGQRDDAKKRWKPQSASHQEEEDDSYQNATALTPRSEPDRRRDQVLFWQTMASITSIPAGKAHLVQLQQTFIDSYFSSGVVSSHRQYFNIFYWLSPHSGAMSASRDALCLIHLGSRRRDFRLVHEGQRRHFAAIHCLRQDLARPGAVEDDAVLGANYTLGQTSVFMAVGHQSQYLTHMAGLQELLLKRGPESMRTPFAQALLYNIRPLSVMNGLVSRKPLFVAERNWIEAARKGLTGEVTISVEMTDLSLQIPGLLQRADVLLAGTKRTKVKAGERDIIALLTELMKVEHGLQSWLLKFYNRTGAERSPYRLSRLADDSFFRGGLGGLAHIFPMTIQFPAFLSATTHVWIWTCLLVIRQTMLDVAALHPYPTVRPQNQETSLTASIDECAVNLCQSIAYLIHTDHASCGIVACSPVLHFSAQWFERQGDTHRLMWVRHVREFLQRDVLLGGGYDTSINVDRPLFTWWMLPDISVEDAETVHDSGRIVEESSASTD